ncbi:hypothetical protein ASPVEDRAFT_881123 [Aspergillus versicolor CBS 583.65]|uniref:Uncharacterized protein n=1 Tax=Aspergillus versicolor CBS 583.65 TaxID=1036611 RepID=A0A1L9PA21_ASPVE|nr:uncharacterized protein ASPVEDRAFT_881123 [Aspergillus versicolor CBS 583.65]OJI98379.1 hypothetical protein ASPVEDRAFT_881123 [Aspergillus versicolor CBS 583.65]
MTSVGEQIFLFGEPDEEPMTGLMEVLAYADLMLSGSLIFAMVVLVGILGFYWETVYPMAVWGANKLTQAIRAVASKAGWLLEELLSIRSYGELKSKIVKAEAVLAIVIAQSLFGRVVSGVVNFYFPYNYPAKTIIRMSLTFIAYMAADVFLLPPLSLCFTTIRDALSEVVYDTRGYYAEMLPEIAHFEIFSGVALSFILLFVGAFWLFSETEANGPVSHKPSPSTATPTEGNKSQEPTQPAVKSTTTSSSFPAAAAATAPSTSSSSSISFALQNLADMRSALRSCKAALAREKATVKLAEKENRRHSDEKEVLRQALILKDRQLRVARGELKNISIEQDGKKQDLKDEVAQLKGDLDFQTEKASRVERRVAELRARLEQPALDRALVNQAASKEQSFEERNCSSGGNYEREAYLMEQLELKTQAENRLRSELESLRAGVQTEIEKIRVGLRQEALKRVRETEQTLLNSQKELRGQLQAATEDAKAKATMASNLQGKVVYLEGIVVSEQSDNKELEEKVKGLKEEIQELRERNLDLELLASAEPAQPAQPAAPEPEPTAGKDQPILTLLGVPDPQDVGHELMRKSAEALAAQQREDFERQIQEHEATIKDLRSEVSTGQRHVRITTNDIERANKTIQDLRAEVKACREHGASQQQAAEDEKAAALSRQLDASREQAEANRREAVRALEYIRMLEAQMQAQRQPDDQKITPMKSSNRGSIATKLEQANVKIVTQGNTISDLRKRIAQLEAGQAQ